MQDITATELNELLQSGADVQLIDVRQPPEYNFAVIPTVKSRRPLWDIKHPTDPDWKYE